MKNDSPFWVALMEALRCPLEHADSVYSQKAAVWTNTVGEDRENPHYLHSS